MFIKTIIILLWNSLFVFNKLQHKITKLMSAFCTQVLRYNVLLNWDNKTNALKFACIVLLFIFILKAKYKIYSFPVVSCGSFPDALRNSSLPSQYNFLWEHSLFLLWSTLIWIFFFFSSRDIDSLSSISPGCLTFDHQQCPCLCVNYRKAFTWFWDHTFIMPFLMNASCLGHF